MPGYAGRASDVPARVRKRTRDRTRVRCGSGLGFALRIGIELVAALAIGVGIGLLLDRWLGNRALDADRVFLSRKRGRLPECLSRRKTDTAMPPAIAGIRTGRRAGRRLTGTNGEQVRQEMAEAGAAAGHHSPLAQFMIKKIIPFQIGGVDISYHQFGVGDDRRRRRGVGLPHLRACAAARWCRAAGSRRRDVLRIRRQHDPRQCGPAKAAVISPSSSRCSCSSCSATCSACCPTASPSPATSIVTFGLAVIVFIGVTIVGFIKHGFHFFGFFLPHGVPLV